MKPLDLLPELSQRIARELKTRSMCRDEICRALHVARTTVYDNVVPLIREGYVIRVNQPAEGGRGRPRTYFAWNVAPPGAIIEALVDELLEGEQDAE